MQPSLGILLFVGRLVSEKRIVPQSTLNVKNPGAHGSFLENRYIENCHGDCAADIPGVLEYKTHNSDGTSNVISLAKFTRPFDPKTNKSAKQQLEEKIKFGIVLDEYVLDGSVIVRKKVTAFTELTSDWNEFLIYRPKQKPDGKYSYSVLKEKIKYMYKFNEDWDV